MIKTEGLTAIRITFDMDTSSVRNGLHHTSSVTLDRATVEREGNVRMGAENMLDPNWRKLTDNEFFDVALRWVERVSGAPFAYPFKEEDREEFYKETGTPEGGVLILLPHHIRNVTLVGVYDD